MQIENALHFSESMLFPVWPLELRGVRDPFFIEKHWHTELEFFTVVEGCCTVTVGGNVHVMSQGDALFVPGALLHQAVVGEEGCWLQGFIFNESILASKRKMYVDKSFWDKIFSADFGLLRHMKGNAAWEKEIVEDIRDVYRLCRQRPYAFELLVKARIDNIFFLLIEASGRKKTIDRDSLPHHQDSLWISICDYIDGHISQTIAVADISRALNVSQRSIYRCARQYGMTIAEYINLCRIDKSCHLLRTTSASITEIGIGLGFADSSHFAAVFKRYMECTPTEFRELVTDKPKGGKTRITNV